MTKNKTTEIPAGAESPDEGQQEPIVWTMDRYIDYVMRNTESGLSEYEDAIERAKTAETRAEAAELELARCLATDHTRFYHLWKARAEGWQFRAVDAEHVFASLADDLIEQLELEFIDDEDDYDLSNRIVDKTKALRARVAELEEFLSAYKDK